MINNIKFKIILQQYKNKIYNYCKYILRNQMDAEDTTQEVMIKFWENIDEVSMLHIKSWLYKTAYNKCIDQLRKRKTQLKRESLFDEEAEYLMYAAADNVPDQLVEVKQKKEILFSAINRLPEDQKNVIIMYELQGLKYREISEVMNLPINTVKVYIMRARKKLHYELKNKRVFSDE